MASFPDRLKLLREKAGMTQEELADKLGVSKGTIGNYETGTRVPKPEKMEAIADLFNVDFDYLVGRSTAAPEFSLEEKWIIESYRKADQYTKDGIRMILKRFDRKEAIPEQKPMKIIPLFPAAAGPDSPVDGEAFDEYEVPEDSKAAFAVRISGDSMEPEFHNGDVVLCEKRIANDGEIAVIMVNGCLLVKQYIPDSFGNIYLRSLNRDRTDLDVDILASGNYTVQGWGTVIHKRIPLVEQ